MENVDFLAGETKAIPVITRRMKGRGRAKQKRGKSLSIRSANLVNFVRLANNFPLANFSEGVRARHLFGKKIKKGEKRKKEKKKRKRR